MNIKVRTNISNEYEDIEIVINSPVKNEQVERLENDLLSKANKSIQKVIGMQGNDIRYYIHLYRNNRNCIYS